MSGENIPYGGRILAVADVFDAITSKRHYRDKMPIQNVIDILISGKNKHFDGNLVDKFLQIPVDRIILVFLTENHHSFKEEDREELSHYNLLDIYNFIINEIHLMNKSILQNCLISIILEMYNKREGYNRINA